ncbi:MAG: hybrid sensor histidine kinase/response regulator [Thermodesulfobacteriota bacterium]
MSPSRKPRVLVVDDTPANLRILSDALRTDFELALAPSGARALEIAFSEEPPDLILLDIMMPEMDGYEVCRRLKDDERTRDVPVLFVTAMAEAEDEAKGLALGAIDYITKPINPALVKARVRNHLALRQAAKLREDVERITRHDLKNPLTEVISLPQILALADNLDDGQREMLSRIEQAGYAMLRLINFSLDLFKMEQGVYRYRPEPLDLASLCRRVAQELEDLAASTGAKVELFVDGRPAAGGEAFTVPGEELLCRSMLGNLVRNALEASPRGGVVRVDLTGGDPARIAVHNAGAAPAQVRERFFEKYVTYGKERGTGLGTYSARLTAEVMGGRISLATSEEDGTAVTVEIPGKKAD